MNKMRKNIRQMRTGIFVFALCLVIAAAGNPSASEYSGYSVSFNGKFISPSADVDCRSISDNGRYYCRYEIGWVGDEVREISNFRIYDNGRLLYSFEKAPGSDVYISNSGITAFMDHKFHFDGKLTVNFYSENGDHLYSKKFTGASLFGFSQSGEMFGVGTPEYLYVISPRSQRIDEFAGGYQFDISAGDENVVVASENRVYFYSHGNLVKEIPTDVLYPRSVKISPDKNKFALIDKRHLFVFSMDGTIVFNKTLSGNLSHRDLMYDNGNIVTGIQYRDKEFSKGIIKVYNPAGEILYENEEASKYIKSPPPPENLGHTLLDYDPIPWPFAPFDSMCTVWNHYEQHMSYGQADWSYLHQGLDIITPIGEPVYAVQGGIVKCVLTLGGDSYWRTAISPEQNPGYSSGWLYAHLVQSSIQFDVGDTVDMYDYLGNIIYWAEDWGHIHFVEITDSGLVWQYYDNEWGIDFNPLLALSIEDDTTAPEFENVFPNEKFGFSRNQTDLQYLDPDSLNGDVDFIVQTVDYIADSPWQLPSFALYYWVESTATGDTVFPRTLAQILNHTYDFFGTEEFVPYATLFYKRDATLLPPYWMDTTRNYYQVLTNNNGDSLGELWEKELSFHTADYPDGEYRIFVEAQDAAGNTNLDSMDVIFINGVSSNPEEGPDLPKEFTLYQNYPNPFNNSTNIRFYLPRDGTVNLLIYDITGRMVDRLNQGHMQAGEHLFRYSPVKLTSGVYYLKLTFDSVSRYEKLILLK